MILKITQTHTRACAHTHDPAKLRKNGGQGSSLVFTQQSSVAEVNGVNFIMLDYLSSLIGGRELYLPEKGRVWSLDQSGLPEALTYNLG